jgi:P4 family phage/plasmid primase-like protien
MSAATTTTRDEISPEVAAAWKAFDQEVTEAARAPGALADYVRSTGPKGLTDKGNGAFKCCSPLRDDRNPSFQVFPGDRGAYDWGTSESFDLYAFAKRYHNLGTHREVLDHLAAHLGITGWEERSKGIRSTSTHESIAVAMDRWHRRHVDEERVFECLTYLCTVAHDMLPDVAREHLRDHYGLSNDLIESEAIGYVPFSFWAILCDPHFECPYDRKTLLSTGFFHARNDGPIVGGGEVTPIFEDRLLFPYWKDGKVRYAIARKWFGRMTDADLNPTWVESHPWQEGKYKKLATRTEKRSYVSPCVKNILWGTDSLRRARNADVWIGEGITDALSLKMLGFPVVSAITVAFANHDEPALLSLLKRAQPKRVIVALDNDVKIDKKTGAERSPGMDGAKTMCAMLWANGYPASIATLPRPDGVEKVDMNEHVTRVMHDARRAEPRLSEAEIEAVARHAVDDLGKNAVGYPEFLIKALPKDTGPADASPVVKEVGRLSAHLDALQQEEVLGRIFAHLPDLAERATRSVFKEGVREATAKKEAGSAANDNAEGDGKGDRKTGEGAGQDAPAATQDHDAVFGPILAKACEAVGRASAADEINVLREWSVKVAQACATLSVADLPALASLRDAYRSRASREMTDTQLFVVLDSAFEEGQNHPRRMPGAKRKAFKRGDDAEIASRILSDRQGAGSALVSCNGALHRYDASLGTWLPIEPAELSRIVQSYAGTELEEVGDKQPTTLRVRAATVHGSIALAHDLADAPTFFDEAKAGIVQLSGFLHVKPAGIEPLPHSPEHRATLRVDFDYAPNTPAPRWKAFLESMLRGDDDARAKMDVLQEFIGVSYFGLAPRFQRCLVLFGGGSNGKSVFVSVVSEIFPPEFRCAIAPQQFEHEYWRATLAGKRLNTVSELPEQEIIRSESFKSIISGDAITGRNPTGRPFRFRPTAGHLFAANQLPKAQDPTDGFWRRLLVVAFTQRVAVEKQDSLLAEKLLEERRGIVNWAIDGAQRALARGRLEEPASSRRAVADWRKSADSVALFVEEALSPEPDVTKGFGAKALYDAFKDWAPANGYRPVSSQTFKQRLQALGFPVHKGRDRNTYPLTVNPKGADTESLRLLARYANAGREN